VRTTAFLQFGVLGDVIIATAVLCEYRMANPSEHITWILLEPYADTVMGNPDVDEVMPWPLKPHLTRRAQERERWEEIKTYAARHFDLIIKPQVFPDHRWEDLAPMTLIEQMFHHAGVKCPARRELVVTSSPSPKPTPGRYVTCNASGNTQPGVWSRYEYSQLARILRGRGITLVVGDGDIPGALRFTGTIREWRSIIESAVAHIGLDSGGTWLAATTQTPQIVIHGSRPTVPTWLTRLKSAGVKDTNLITEFTSPSVETVAAQLL